MTIRARTAAAALAMLLTAAHARAASDRPGVVPRIVAAENFYGDVAAQIAGPDVAVRSILSNPDEDPHLFEASPSVARALSAASIVIYNGAGYDPWMARLLDAARSAHRQSIVASRLVGARPGANPHLWYDPATMPALARALTGDLVHDDPAHAANYRDRCGRFLASLLPIDAKVAALRAKYAGLPVTATEPVFGLMAASLGLVMRNQRFQLAVMNNTEPSAADIAAMEHDLRGRKVRVLIYNSQATDDTARRLLAIARMAHVPVLGVTETEPRGVADYQQWVLGQLEALDHALARPPS